MWEIIISRNTAVVDIVLIRHEWNVVPLGIYKVAIVFPASICLICSATDGLRLRIELLHVANFLWLVRAVNLLVRSEDTVIFLIIIGSDFSTWVVWLLAEATCAVAILPTLRTFTGVKARRIELAHDPACFEALVLLVKSVKGLLVTACQLHSPWIAFVRLMFRLFSKWEGYVFLWQHIFLDSCGLIWHVVWIRTAFSKLVRCRRHIVYQWGLLFID